jgi:hypothetical protein
MSTRRIERALNRGLQAVESRGSSVHINLSKQRLNTKLVSRIIATARRRKTRMVMRARRS